MKIVILADDFPPNSFGGAGIVAFEQSKGLAESGHQVYVITTVEDKLKAGRTEYEGLIIYSLHTEYPKRFRAYVSLYNPAVVSGVKKILAEIKPDIVHAHNVHEKISYASLSIARKYSEKVFLTAHDVMLFHYSKLYPKYNSGSHSSYQFDYRVSWLSQAYYFRLTWNPFRNLLIKWYIRNIDTVFVVSKALGDALLQNGIKNTALLYNGINSLNFVVAENDRQSFIEKHELKNKKILFFAGRMSKAKGGDIILQVVKQIVVNFPETHFMFAGKKDSYVDSFLSQAESLGLLKNISFLGWIDRDIVKQAYASSDIVLTLSKYLDPFPTTNLEAMASKKPVIGTCFGGTPELVLDHQTGYIVDPYNIDSVVHTAHLLLSNPVLAKSLGQAGYERVVSEFSLQKQIQSLLRYYEHC